MKYKSQNKGITLVALVITVVVMLILAGVAIAQFTGGDGIFSRVTDATREYKKQSMLEAVDLAKAYLEMEQTYKNEPITITDVIDKVKEISSINDEDYIITIDDEEQSATIIDKQTGVVIDIWIDENGEIQVEGSIVDDIENVVKPIITYTLDPPAGTYGEAVKITITATEEKNGIVRMVLPDNSEITYNNEKTVTREYIVTENGTYKFTVEGANGRETTKYVKVDNIMSASEIVMEVQNTNPTNQNISIKITYDENVKSGGQVLINADRFQYSIGENNWQIATEAETTISVGVNGIVYARYYDGTTGFKTKSITVQNIDKVAPNAFNLSTSKTTNSITVSGSTEDTATAGCATNNYGIRGYQFQLKNSSGGIITDWTTETTATSYTFTNLTQGTTYQVSMRAVDKAGNPTEATNKDESVTLNTVVDSSTAITSDYTPKTPTTENVQVTFTNNSGDSNLTLKYQKGSTSGSWTEYTGPITMETNGYVYARLFDENDQYTKTATVTIQNIDRVAPNAFNLSTSKTTNSITVSGSTEDTATAGCATNNYGIRGYQFQLKNSSGGIITDWTTETTATSYTFTNLTQGTTYQVSMRAVDKAGNITEARNKDLSVELELANRTLSDMVKDGTIEAGDWIAYEVKNGSGTNNGEYTMTTLETGAESDQTYNVTSYTEGWLVLYADTSTGVVEIISANSVGNLKLAYNSGYNNLVSTLNTMSEYYLNPQYADRARSVGTNPNNPIGETETEENRFGSMIIEDEHYITDLNALDNLELTKINSSYWLASRKMYRDSSLGIRGGHGRFIDASGTLDSSLLASDDVGSSESHGVRPCIRLKTNIEIDMSDATRDRKFAS